MIVYPAIDIRGGRCVRLVEGDFDRETVYDADPAEAAQRWVAEGAQWLHVVDLDGAVVGEPVNVNAVTRIRASVDVPIQLGGGLRLEEHLAAAFDHGVDRVVLGTAPLRSPDLIGRGLARWPDSIAIALDSRDGRLAAEGWLDQTDTIAVDVAERLQGEGVRHFIYTDIARDGTLKGPNLAGLRALVDRLDVDVVASGGIASIGDIAEVAEVGAAGVIVGRALYDRRVNLASAIATASSTRVQTS